MTFISVGELPSRSYLTEQDKTIEYKRERGRVHCKYHPCMVYLSTFPPKKSTIHVGKYTSPMDPMGTVHYNATQRQYSMLAASTGISPHLSK